MVVIARLRSKVSYLLKTNFPVCNSYFIFVLRLPNYPTPRLRVFKPNFTPHVLLT